MLPGDRAAPLIRTLMPSLNASGTGAFYRSIGVASKLHAAKGRTALPEPIGAGEGNRTLVVGLGSLCSTIELHPQSRGILAARRRRLHRAIKLLPFVSRLLPPGSFFNFRLSSLALRTRPPIPGGIKRRPGGLHCDAALCAAARRGAR